MGLQEILHVKKQMQHLNRSQLDSIINKLLKLIKILGMGGIINVLDRSFVN